MSALPPDDASGRHFDEPWQVLLDGCQQPVEAVVDRWRETGRWWDGEPVRDFCVLQTPQAVVVVCSDKGGWRVEEVLD